jgi:hypothetical protein
MVQDVTPNRVIQTQKINKNTKLWNHFLPSSNLMGSVATMLSSRKKLICPKNFDYPVHNELNICTKQTTYTQNFKCLVIYVLTLSICSFMSIKNIQLHSGGEFNFENGNK